MSDDKVRDALIRVNGQQRYATCRKSNLGVMWTWFDDEGRRCHTPEPFVTVVLDPDVLATVRADAWDQGIRHRRLHDPWTEALLTENPYRTEATPKQ